MGLLSTFTDPLLEVGFKKILSHFVNDFGEVSGISINTNNKSINATLVLKGEPGPILMSITKYQIVAKKGAEFFVINEYSISREWIDLATKKYMSKPEFEIPKPFVSVVKKLLQSGNK